MAPLINESSNQHNASDPVLTAKFDIKVDLIRASLQTIEVGWGLLVMLVAMTYNVGLFSLFLLELLLVQ